MARREKVSVVWELLDGPEPGQENRVVVDVDAPLRPFGSIPTPPRGTAMSRVPLKLKDDDTWDDIRADVQADVRADVRADVQPDVVVGPADFEDEVVLVGQRGHKLPRL